MKNFSLLIVTLLLTSWQAFASSDARISSKEAPSTAAVGERIAIRTDLRNSGTSSSPAFTMYYYISPTPDLNNVTPLRNGSNYSDGVRAMSPGGDDDENHWPTIPNLTPGTYYIVWHLNVNDGNTSNNVVTKQITITGAKPDLRVSRLTIPYGIIKCASSRVEVTIKNDGSVTAPGNSAYAVRISWGSNGQYERGTRYIVPALAPGASHTEYLFPIVRQSGPVTFTVTVDFFNSVSEESESNNVRTISTTVPYSSTNCQTGGIIGGGGGPVPIEQIYSMPDNIGAPQPAMDVYPNPTTGTFHVNVAAAIAATTTITVINSLGEVVLKRTVNANSETTLDLSEYENGLYIIQRETAGSVETQRLFKQ